MSKLNKINELSATPIMAMYYMLSGNKISAVVTEKEINKQGASNNKRLVGRTTYQDSDLSCLKKQKRIEV